MKNEHRRVPASMDFWVDDWIGGTYWFSAEQEACYLRLVMWQWKAGAIPDDEKQMVSRTRVAIEVLRGVLEEKFELKDGLWTNGKTKSVRDHAIAKLETLRKNGLKGGRPKKTKSKANGSLTETKSKPNGKMEDGRWKTSLNTNKEVQSYGNIELPFDSNELRAAWREYIDLRRTKKYTLSDRVIRRLVKALANYCSTATEAVEVLERAINGAWKDFYPSGSNGSQSVADKIERLEL